MRVVFYLPTKRYRVQRVNPILFFSHMSDMWESSHMSDMWEIIHVRTLRNGRFLVCKTNLPPNFTTVKFNGNRFLFELFS